MGLWCLTEKLTFLIQTTLCGKQVLEIYPYFYIPNDLWAEVFQSNYYYLVSKAVLLLVR